MGYQSHVQQELEGRAQVWAPEPNGGDSRNVLAHLDEWILSRSADVLHLNCGLHDLKKPFDSICRQVEIEKYEDNLSQIFTRLRSESACHLIWATITPVNEAWHHQHKGFDRLESDIARYNEAALSVARSFCVDLNNLHGVIIEAGADRLLCEDGVHFAEEGSRLLGSAVAAAVSQHLSIE
ncbi:MAG: SGNH/GDSL hydrolase family protein [Candidatus Latescibacterota bacterium]|nr:SGNH/GDSL hydrolase family protein [Candidatus Latescibacterota bacterium]